MYADLLVAIIAKYNGALCSCSTKRAILMLYFAIFA